MANQDSRDNLPAFQAAQLEFAAHIRHPDRNEPPSDIETRRMQIYVRLFYNNIEAMCSRTFHIAKKVLGDETWAAMVRDFYHRHVSTSPYFVDIPQEFLVFLSEGRDKWNDPEYLVELCHYEWLSLHLRLAAAELPVVENVQTDLMQHTLQLSPLAFALSYQWPVHEIDETYQPSTAPSEKTWMVAYRNRENNIIRTPVSQITVVVLTAFKQPRIGLEVIDELAEGSDEESALATRLKSQISDLIERDVLLVLD